MHHQQLNDLSLNSFSDHHNHFQSHNKRVKELQHQIIEKDSQISQLEYQVQQGEKWQDQVTQLKQQMQLYIDKINWYERQLQEKVRSAKQIETVISPQLVRYEKELAQVRETCGKLQGENRLLRNEIAHKDNLLAQLRSKLTETQNIIQSLTEKHSFLQNQFTTSFDKEYRLDNDLQNTNEMIQRLNYENQDLQQENQLLRSELEKCTNSLEKCQIELSFIPKIRNEMQRNEDLINLTEQKLLTEKENSEEMAKQRDEAIQIINQITKLCQEQNPLEYIKGMEMKIKKQSNQFSNLSETLKKIEQKQVEQDQEAQWLIGQIVEYLKALSENIQHNFFDTQINFSRFPDLKHQYQNLYSTFRDLVNIIKVVRKEACNKIDEQNDIMQELRQKQTTLEITIQELQEDNEQLMEQISYHKGNEESYKFTHISTEENLKQASSMIIQQKNLIKELNEEKVESVNLIQQAIGKDCSGLKLVKAIEILIQKNQQLQDENHNLKVNQKLLEDELCQNQEDLTKANQNHRQIEQKLQERISQMNTSMQKYKSSPAWQIEDKDLSTELENEKLQLQQELLSYKHVFGDLKSMIHQLQDQINKLTQQQQQLLEDNQVKAKIIEVLQHRVSAPDQYYEDIYKQQHKIERLKNQLQERAFRPNSLY